ncbi:MAG: YeeE/YedE thiosulfate transporter family protein [Roseibacillus sp.]
MLAAIFGTLFGSLLNKGRVTDYNVIVNFFRFRDMTVPKVMLTAITVGSIGVYLFARLDWIAGYHIKDTLVLGVSLGGLLFGAGMVIYGYCPGTGIAAAAIGSVHALIGMVGMLVGGILYALSYGWVNEHILSVGVLGKIRLDEATPVPAPVWIALLIIATFLSHRFLKNHSSSEA